MFETLISGGTLVNAEEERKADLAIADGRIAAILPPGERVEARRVLDVSGCLLLPGLVDVHVESFCPPRKRQAGLAKTDDQDSAALDRLDFARCPSPRLLVLRKIGQAQ